MRNPTAAVLTILLIAAVIFLGFYAAGRFDGEDGASVSGVKYVSGEFVFTGKLKSGYFNGNGIIDFQNGGKFEGMFKNGRFDGEAVYSENANNWYFSGAFQNGRAGNGAFYLNGTKIEYSRESETDVLAGADWRYDGAFNERGQNGKGSFTFGDGSVYTGVFLNGLANGKGKYVGFDGNTIYEGDFKDGRFDGQGVYFYPDGRFYEGGFSEGTFDGEGKATDADGTAVSGIWEKGVQIMRHG
jgi:hypothetical protein